MKIIISIAEAKNTIANCFNETNERTGVRVTGNDVTIQLPPTDNVANYVESIIRVTKEFPNHTSNEKMLAITRLKTLTGIGLVNAKLAVENPQSAIDKWIQYGTYLSF